MATGKVIKSVVDAIQPQTRDQFLWDVKLRGFGLKITPAGNKVYLVQYRLGGQGTKTRRYTIGTHGSPWTPDNARKEAERVLTVVGQGRDPMAEKEERERVTTELAFGAYADRFLAKEVRVNWKKSYDEIDRLFRLHIRGALKSKPLPSIRKADITALLDALPAEQAALRRKVYAVLSRLFSWAVEQEDIERSPLTSAGAPPAPEARDRTLADWELRLAWIASGDLGYPFGPLYRLLIGTGQRREEVSSLDWKELHRATAEWSLPATRAKNGIANKVHLSPAMIGELDVIAGGEKWPRRGFVFTTTGETAVSGYSRAKTRLDRAMLKLARNEAAAADEDPDHVEIAPWRAHDLRRTLGTGLQRIGVRFEVIESILNHVSGSRSGVAGIYQRHDWKSEKRDALNAWAAHVERVVAGAEETNVVQFAPVRA